MTRSVKHLTASYRIVSYVQYLLDPAKGMAGAEVNQLHVHGGSALMEVSLVVLRLWLSFVVDGPKRSIRLEECGGQL